jgi:release factor glutamine methyltransferase
LTTAELQVLRSFVERRRQHEPVSRILGEREFYGRTFAISPATLDPRPDSETLIAAALEIVREEGWMSCPTGILDVGTGSGCLLLTLLCEMPQATGLGTDISAAALDTASLNADRLGLGRRAVWLRADGLESIAGPFHMLVANPPYVRTGEIPALEPEVRNFDPTDALDGGPDGLAMYRRLLPRIANVISAGGWVVLEVGHDQAADVAALLASKEAGIDAAGIRIHHDVAGRRRCVAARTRDRRYA